MTSALEKIDATTVKLTVTLTDEDIAPVMKHAYEHVGEQVQIPGFRKGKVPPKILEQRVGKGAIIEHAVNDGLPGWYSEAVQEQGIRPYGQPEVEVIKVPARAAKRARVHGDRGGAPRGDAARRRRPHIVVAAPRSATRTSTLASRRCASASARSWALTAPPPRATSSTLDLAAALSEDVDAVQGTSYQVGAGNMLEGLDDVLAGLSAGEETTYEGPLAAGDHAGETATITVKVTAVKARELPDADDDFAQLARVRHVAELREDLREQAGRIKTNNQAMEAREKLLETLTEATDFELPKKVIEQRGAQPPREREPPRGRHAPRRGHRRGV